jgi:RNA polymerase sigma factor (sigma-70 family)
MEIAEASLDIAQFHLNHETALALAARLTVLHDLLPSPIATDKIIPIPVAEMPLELTTELPVDPITPVDTERLTLRRIRLGAEQTVKRVIYDAKTPPPKFVTPISRESTGTEDPLNMYLKEIGHYPLLNKDKEVKLSQMIEAGRIAQDKLVNSDSEDVDMKQLLVELEIGKSAKQWFINTNLRLVVNIAKRYQKSGVPLLDLIQEGNFGLEHAVDKFKWEKGFKFSTYATWWIRQAITRGIANTGRAVRLPVHAGDNLRIFNKEREALELKNGRKPSIEEIANAMKISPLKAAGIEIDGRREPISIDAPVGEGSSSRFNSTETTRIDLIPDTRVDVEGSSIAHALPEEIEKVLASLDSREREVLILRYGLDRGEPRSLEEVGACFNLTRERIRQIAVIALAKLQDPSSPAQGLKIFLQD